MTMRRHAYLLAPILLLGLSACAAQVGGGVGGSIIPIGPAVGMPHGHGPGMGAPPRRGQTTMPMPPNGHPPPNAPMSDRDLAGMAYRNLGSTPTGQQPNWAGVIPNNSSFRRPDNGAPCKKVNESRASGWIFDRWACPRAQTVGM